MDTRSKRYLTAAIAIFAFVALLIFLVLLLLVFILRRRKKTLQSSEPEPSPPSSDIPAETTSSDLPVATMPPTEMSSSPPETSSSSMPTEMSSSPPETSSSMPAEMSSAPPETSSSMPPEMSSAPPDMSSSSSEPLGSLNFNTCSSNNLIPVYLETDPAATVPYFYTFAPPAPPKVLENSSMPIFYGCSDTNFDAQNAKTLYLNSIVTTSEFINLVLSADSQYIPGSFFSTFGLKIANQQSNSSCNATPINLLENRFFDSGLGRDVFTVVPYTGTSGFIDSLGRTWNVINDLQGYEPSCN